MSFERNSSLIVLCLCSSLRLQVKYRTFRVRLEEVLTLKSTLPTANADIVVAVEVLQTKRAGGLATAEDCDGMDGGSRASTTGQDETKVDEAGEPWAVDEAFETLVRNAIDKFGFAPHDVYEGVFRLSTATTDHTNAVRNLRWAELKLIISTFTREMSLDVGSHRVVAVYPLPNPPSDYRDGWSIEIKSYEITRQVLDRLKEEEDISIREVIDYFRKIPEGSTYAGRWFEMTAHRVLSRGWLAGDPVPQPIHMESHLSPRDRHLIFSTEPPSTTSTWPPAPVRTVPRMTTSLNFPDEISEVTLHGGRYYKPIAPDLPFFDSFTTDHDHDRDALVISIFQMTISSEHRGSAEDFDLIRKIMAHVAKLLEEAGHPATKVEVVYFLVGLTGEHERKWHMPHAWEKDTSDYDHRGSVFCIKFPV